MNLTELCHYVKFNERKSGVKMDLWIKSQDREQLLKVDNILATPRMETSGEWLIMFHNIVLGAYLTKKRALEVLDEIQSKMKTLLCLKPNLLLRPEDLVQEKEYYEKLNKQEFITCNNNFEIIPISNNTVIYEMPKE